MSLNLQFTQDLSLAGCSEGYGQDKEATLSLTPGNTVEDANFDKPTQVFSPGYIEAHLSGQQVVDLDFSKLRLDSIVSKDLIARILMYPKILGLDILPYRGAGRYDNWVEVEMDNRLEGTESARVLVVAPSAEQLGCSIAHDNASFRLYFDPGAIVIVRMNGNFLLRVMVVPLSSSSSVAASYVYQWHRQQD